MRVRVRGVNTIRKRLSNGSVAIYRYHRATNTKLPGEPGSVEFLKAYAAAEEKTVRRPDNTLVGLIDDFQRSADWARLAESTRKQYLRIFKIIEKRYGSVPLPALEDRLFRRDVLEWRDEHAKTAPREADYRITSLARVLAFGADRGTLHVNILRDVRRVYKADRAQMIWLPSHIESFKEHAPVELRWALMLALHTGQRQGDLLKLSWTAYDGREINLRQGKTGAQVVVPCTSPLKAMLDGMERKQAVILTNEKGLPWNSNTFHHKWSDACKAAGIEKLHFHDLRGTAVTMLAEAGCTHMEIAAITGHSLKYVAQIIDAYLARTRDLAYSAITKLEDRIRTDFAN